MGLGNTPENIKAQQELLAQMMRLSGRPMHVGFGVEDSLTWFMSLRDEGLPVFSQQIAIAFQSEFKLSEYNLFDYMPHWVQPLVGTPEERATKLRDPASRAAMKRDVEEIPFSRTDWTKVRVLEVVHERNYRYEGLTVRQIADMVGKHPVDAFLDLALDEGLETLFSHPGGVQDDESELEERIKDPYTHVSNSDGGAHTRFLTISLWPVYVLSHWVRDKEVMSLEQAHYKISSLPAWLADFKDRGTLRVGSWADIIVYNQAELGFLYDKPVFATDFPGGERRLIQKPTGLRYTIVNGAVTFEDNECTGALPGKLLRSYEMTA